MNNLLRQIENAEFLGLDHWNGRIQVDDGESLYTLCKVRLGIVKTQTGLAVHQAIVLESVTGHNSDVWLYGMPCEQFRTLLDMLGIPVRDWDAFTGDKRGLAGHTVEIMEEDESGEIPR